jgi:hypothetical protein
MESIFSSTGATVRYPANSVNIRLTGPHVRLHERRYGYRPTGRLDLNEVADKLNGETAMPIPD